MHVLPASFAVAAVLLLLAFSRGEGSTEPPAPRTEPPPAPVVLAERRADFHEGEDPSRVVAALEARIVREGARTLFRMTASALGPRVAPPPGAEGVAGANRITSEEIESIVANGRMEVRVGDGKGAPGRVRAGRLAALPVRRLAADGRVEHVAAGGRSRVLALEVEVDLVGEGRFPVDLLVDGRPRVRALLHVRGARATVVALEEVPSHDGGSAR